MPQDNTGMESYGGGAPAGIGSAIGGLISGVSGFFQRREGKRMLRNMQYPTQVTPNEIYQNQAQAQINANNGLPSAQYQQAMQNIQRQQNSAIRMAGDRRAGLGLIGGIQSNTNNALLGLDTANAKARLQNQNTLYGINNQLAGWKQKEFDWNVKNKYQRDYNYAQGLVGAGNQNLVAGADKFASGLLGGFDKLSSALLGTLKLG